MSQPKLLPSIPAVEIDEGTFKVTFLWAQCGIKKNVIFVGL